MKQLVLYVHGKGGNEQESEHYISLFPRCDVKGLRYQANSPWEACEEFPPAFEALSRDYDSVILIANSIGAYLSICALPQEKICRVYFISPIVDMERLIEDMMIWSNVTEADLKQKGEIETSFGETLSWRYLEYVRSHPIDWKAPTYILYGAWDRMTSKDTISAFAQAHGAQLTVMEQGEHWFHTPEQMAFLDAWISEREKACMNGIPLVRLEADTDVEN